MKQIEADQQRTRRYVRFIEPSLLWVELNTERLQPWRHIFKHSPVENSKQECDLSDSLQPVGVRSAHQQVGAVQQHVQRDAWEKQTTSLLSFALYFPRGFVCDGEQE